MSRRIKRRLAFLLSMMLSVSLLLASPAQAVNPLEPGNSFETAWGFQSAINTTQRLPAVGNSHFYRLVVNTNNFEANKYILSFSASGNCRMTVYNSD